MSSSEKSSSSAIVTGLIFVAIVVAVIFFLFSGKTRALYVVNHTPQTMTLKLPSGVSQELEPNTWAQVEIALELQSIALFEGLDSIGVMEIDPLIHSQKDDGILVYNIQGAGVIVWEEVVYSEDPDILETTEGDWAISVGEEVSFFENADYIFEEGPEEIYITSLEDYEIKSQLTFLDWKPMEVSDWLAVAVEDKDDPVGSTMTYMENQIQLGHDDLFFVENYFDYADSNDETERANSSMKSLGWSQGEWIDITHFYDPDAWGIAFDGLEDNFDPIMYLDSVAVDERNAKLVLSFPLDTAFHFDIQSLTGQFTLRDLIHQTHAIYTDVYDEEAATSTISPEEIMDETTGQRRNETNGAYGIWGYRLEDLAISGFSQMRNGETLYVIPWVFDDY